MKPFNITTNGIIKLLKNLNPYKAQGPDNISCYMMFLAMICSRILQQTDVSEIGR
jgi:hypothetical protein